jgi:hypothetical protein
MMSHHEAGQDAIERDGEESSIERVAAELRAPVPIRAEFRAGLLRGVSMLAPPGSGAETERVVRRWRLRPLTAIAAGLTCAIAGGLLTALLLGRPYAPASSAALTDLTATMPLPGESAAASGGHATVRFVFVAPYASRVSLVGDFNRWNPTAMPMNRSTDGRAWLIDVPLAPGRHVYAFIVDGDLAPDPAAPRAGDDDFGVPSSVVLVGGAAKS